MSDSFRSRVLITGAGSGIGLGLAQLFAQNGFEVIVTDRDESRAQASVREGPLAVHHASAFRLDVAEPSEVSSVLRKIGPVGIVVNNAGLQHVARLEEFPAQSWHYLIQVLLSGVADVMRAVLPGMRHEKFGRIINIGSIHSLVASPYKSAYVAAKHGLLGLSKAIALENADLDITVNTICPAYVRTALVNAQIQAQAKAHGISVEEVVDDIMLAPMPKHAFIEVEEIFALASYLASSMARNVTAQAIAIDGGWTASS